MKELLIRIAKIIIIIYIYNKIIYIYNKNIIIKLIIAKFQLSENKLKALLLAFMD